jgi:replicative DNA helicase
MSAVPSNGHGQAPQIGAAPPHSIEAEQSVLGAVLLWDGALYGLVIEEGLKPEDFYRDRHRLIYESMLALYQESQPVDPLTVTEHLRSRGELENAGGQAEVDGLTGAVPAVGNALRYGRIVREHALLRRLLAKTYEIQTAVLNRTEQPNVLVELAERGILEVAHDDRTKDFRQVGEVLEVEIDKWQRLSREGIALTGTPSGFGDLDEITGGFQPGNLIVLAARPSMGKSALVTNIAENVALHPDRPQPVALFSLEMSEAELAQRFIASQATIKGDDLRKGRLKDERKWKRVLDTATRYDKAPLFVDDSSDIGILEIRAKARRLHQQTDGGLGLIIVDYLQLMRPDPTIDSRVQQVGEMSRGLKILARELGVPVIALSQLSRAVESRSATDKRPMLSDLRECVTGDTLVCVADGRRVPIRDLVGTQPEVLALDDRDQIVRAHSDLVWPVGTRDVFTVRLASGRRIRATADHRIRTGGGWSTVGELTTGDRVALASRIPEPAEPVRWPDEHVVLLGQMIGDGSYLSGQPMRYTTASEDNSAAVTTAAESFGATVKRYRGRGSWHQLLVSGNGTRWAPRGVNAWLRQLGIFGQRSHEKRIPAEAFRLGDRQVGLLLEHLWATDGCLWVGARADGRPLTRIAFGTSSRGLADDVAALLLRLGIVARIVEAPGPERPMFQVTVTGSAQQRRFLDRVGAFGPRRKHENDLRALLASTKGATNVDTHRAMAATRGTSYGGSAHFAFAPSRVVVADYAAALEDAELTALLDAEIFWDRVVAVEPAGEEEVFDLTVPGPSCWLADGIVSHNSGQIEQDADLVMFIYRDEYYFPETTEHPGEAELIIAKHRNGGLGTVHVSFQSEFPRFLGLSHQAG